MNDDDLAEFRRRYAEVSVQITPGSVWEDVETGERVTIQDFDGAYGYGLGDRPGRFQEKRINWDHFGRTFRRIA